MIFNAYADSARSIEGITPVSCGHIFAKPEREIFRPEGREDWLLFYVAKGTETFYFNQKEVRGEAGSFVLFAPRERQHHFYEGSQTGEFYFVHFQCDRLPKTCTLKTSHLYTPPLRRQVCDLFEEIIDETLQKQPCYDALFVYKLLELMTLLEREAAEAHPKTTRFALIAPAVHHMNKHYNSGLKLEDYAALCHMSKYHFLRVFQAITGSTPLEYRNRIRLEHAAELLREERLSVEEVGTLTGFSSAAYFSSAFKKKFGVSPKQYRRLEPSIIQ